MRVCVGTAKPIISQLRMYGLLRFVAYSVVLVFVVIRGGKKG